jgi:predicted acetyltransferase
MSLSWRGYDYIREDYKEFREGKDTILLALDDGNIVGWALLHPGWFRTKFYVFINSKYRQRGLGRGLFRLACRRIKHGTIIVYPHDESSRAYYKRMEGVAKEFRKKIRKINAEQ